MKKIFVSSLALIFMSISLFGQFEKEVAKADEWTWFGIDYTQCYFLTPMDFPSVSDLEAKIGAWNDLVLLERDKYIDNTIGRKKINYYIDMIKERNEEIDVKSRLTEDGFMTTHMEASMVQDILDGYFIDDAITGIGLVLIAESYSKPNTQGSYYVTFFDIQSRRVLATERMLGKSGGFGLRNYWAKTYYNVLKDVGKKYK